MPARNLAWFAVVLLVAAVVYMAEKPQPAQQPTLPAEQPQADPFSALRQVRSLIAARHLGETGDSELLAGAIRGMLQAADPYSDYVGPGTPGEDATVGRRVGVGIEVDQRAGQFVILNRIDGTSAAQAGVLPGDILVYVDDVRADELAPGQVEQRIHGPSGSVLRLVVRRFDGAREQLLEFALQRGAFDLPTLRGFARKRGGRWDWNAGLSRDVGYVAISSFTGRTEVELAEVLRDLLREGIQRVILDLRFNIGGSLEAAAACANLLLERGVIFHRVDRRAGRTTFEARPTGSLPPFQLVLLVNGYTASAAEVFAGALQQNGRALVVGERTWGKGTVQSSFELESGLGRVKLTTAKLLLPDGSNLHRYPGAGQWGVSPDIEQPMSVEQVHRMLSARERADARALSGASTTKPIISPGRLDGPNLADVYELLAADVQLAAALQLLTIDARGGLPATQPAD